MTIPLDPNAPERLRILSLDGGPSTPVMLRILRHLEERNPGFLERTDMFAGASDGAFASLYLAHTLSQGYTGLEALDACIGLHNKIIMTFQVTLRGVLRMASGLLSMFDGQALSDVLTAHYKTRDGMRDAVLDDLKKAVSIECYDATTRQTATYTKLKTPQTTLVNAALASAACSPVLPAFRNQQASAAYRGNLMLDGAMANNSPVLPAISDGLQHLWKRSPPSRSAPESFIDADDNLRNISMVSMGCGIQPQPFVRELYAVPLPPFGLQKNKNLYQYGLLWTLASNVSGLLATAIQRQATDDSLFAMQLLGAERFIRFAPDEAGLATVLTLAFAPKQFLVAAEERANALWEGIQGANLSSWVQLFWMRNPPLPQGATAPAFKSAG